MVWYYSCKSAIHSSPVVYGEYVFFGSDDGRLYALDKTNGELAWTFAPEYTINDEDANNWVTTPILSDPVVENGVLYIESKGTVYALDPQTAEIQKAKPAQEAGINLLTTTLFLLLILLGVALIAVPYIKKKR